MSTSMHVITEIAAARSVNTYLHLQISNMAGNEGTLVNFEEEKQFLFNYRKKIRRFEFIRWGCNRQAIVRRRVKKKIKPFDPNLYESLMKGEIGEEKIPYDYWYSLKDRGIILPHSPGTTISYFASLKGVYFCRHPRDHRGDFQWLAARSFS